jgi:transcriptional regulator with PAS, ATPase and Fis domain
MAMDLTTLKQRFNIIGNNSALNEALEVAVRVASTDLSVLITGESGVGKEVFPQIIHANSPRKHGTYIAVNCGAIPEGTIDSELFGHEKGAFTGASESRKGYFEVADGGTIFLDEVAELPHTTQVRLLRVLQTGEYIRVGSSKTQKTNVRVVAATNINLRDAVRDGRFREDLYYRLNTVPITVPPLRDRKGDIYLLFRKFAVDVATLYRMPVITLDEGARQVLETYPWPGNIRQLKNVAEQISAVEESRNITADILKKYLPDYAPSSVPVFRPQAQGEVNEERELLYKVLFDLRNDMNDLKRMMAELMAEHRGYDHKGGDVTALLPRNLPAPVSTPTVHPMPVSFNDYAEPEEVIEEPAAREGLTKEQVLREAIIKALRRHGGKRREAAKDLFISERTLYRKIKELGIDEY